MSEPMSDDDLENFRALGSNSFPLKFTQEGVLRLVHEIDRLRAENVQLTAENKSLEEITAEAWASTEPESTYGPFPGGDPRNFTPDEECCTPEELEAWKIACCEWNLGRGVDRGPSCATMGDGSVWSGSGFGVGVYRWDSEPAQ